MSPNIIQWIFASIATYFDTNKGDYNLVVEGDQFDLENVDLWVDLQVGEYKSTQMSKTRWRCECDLTITINEAPVNEDTYRVKRAAGYFMSLFNSIPIYRYGPTAEPENDDEYIACLMCQNPIVVNYYGAGSNIAQATVSSHFQMSYEETS